MKLSVVSPVYNEEGNLPLLYDAVRKALEPLGIDWELILIDDGSKDCSLKEMEKLADADPGHVCLICLRRNFGQTAAIAAGIDHATGDVVVLMDADLQNDPADIPIMLEKINEGYDVVSGWRIKRKDSYLTRTLPYNLVN